jgi:hypothetical protein
VYDGGREYLMKRHTLMLVVVALALGSAAVLAQDGDLSGVTMRVVDDLSSIDAVVLVLEASGA